LRRTNPGVVSSRVDVARRSARGALDADDEDGERRTPRTYPSARATRVAGCRESRRFILSRRHFSRDSLAGSSFGVGPFDGSRTVTNEHILEISRGETTEKGTTNARGNGAARARE